MKKRLAAGSRTNVHTGIANQLKAGTQTTPPLRPGNGLAARAITSTTKRFMVSALTLLLLSFCPQAISSPDLFSQNSFADVKSQSRKSHKFVIVDFMATWCGPCNYMDETTWTDRNVIDWVHKNAIAVQIDVDKQEKIAAEFAIEAMPTVVVLDPTTSAEIDRHRGYLDAEKFLLWMESLESGESTYTVITRKFEESKGKGDKEEVLARHRLAKADLEAAKYDSAIEQYLWLWSNMEKLSPDLTGERSSNIALEMHKLALLFPPAKARFQKLRDEESKSLDDWITLNKILGESNKTFAWFDKNKSDPAFLRNIPAPARSSLQGLFISRDRLGDLGILFEDPASEIVRVYKIAKANPEYMDRFTGYSSTMYAALLVANRNKEADEVSAKCVELDNTPRMRLELARMWFKAMQQKIISWAQVFSKTDTFKAVMIASPIILVLLLAFFRLKKRSTSK